MQYMMEDKRETRGCQRTTKYPVSFQQKRREIVKQKFFVSPLLFLGGVKENSHFPSGVSGYMCLYFLSPDIWLPTPRSPKCLPSLSNMFRCKCYWRENCRLNVITWRIVPKASRGQMRSTNFRFGRYREQSAICTLPKVWSSRRLTQKGYMQSGVVRVWDLGMLWHLHVSPVSLSIPKCPWGCFYLEENWDMGWGPPCEKSEILSWK